MKMISSKYRFTLDLHSLQSQISLPALIGDTSRTLYINFTDGGEPYFIDIGCLAKISIKRPTGTHLEDFCEIQNNTTAVYHFSQNVNTCAVEGIYDCDITLYDAEGYEIGSPKFSLIVSERVTKSDDLNITDDDRNVVQAMLISEASRKESELGRVKAEAERVTAESERVTRFQQLEEEFDYLAPTASVKAIEGGHRVTITDSKKETSFNVMDGAGADCRLPSVTTSDNGKFLRVEGGEWKVSTVPSAEGGAY
jgi:hypothetical protein